MSRAILLWHIVIFRERGREDSTIWENWTTSRHINGLLFYLENNFSGPNLFWHSLTWWPPIFPQSCKSWLTLGPGNRGCPISAEPRTGPGVPGLLPIHCPISAPELILTTPQQPPLGKPLQKVWPFNADWSSNICCIGSLKCYI